MFYKNQNLFFGFYIFVKILSLNEQSIEMNNINKN
jgi:hypothetical protein